MCSDSLKSDILTLAGILVRGFLEPHHHSRHISARLVCLWALRLTIIQLPFTVSAVKDQTPYVRKFTVWHHQAPNILTLFSSAVWSTSEYDNTSYILVKAVKNHGLIYISEQTVCADQSFGAQFKNLVLILTAWQGVKLSERIDPEYQTHESIHVTLTVVTCKEYFTQERDNCEDIQADRIQIWRSMGNHTILYRI